MREINGIIVHCSATRPEQDISVPQIRQWHMGRGWSDIGYHYVIRRNGIIDTGRPIERQGAHARGHNHDTVGICLVGGIGYDMRPDANYTAEQFAKLATVIRDMVRVYGLTFDDVRGHRDLPGVTKACPCFDVRAFIERFRHRHG